MIHTMRWGRSVLVSVLWHAAFVGMAWGCGTPAEPPVGDASGPGGTTSVEATSTTTPAGATSSNPSTVTATSSESTTDIVGGSSTTGDGAIECWVGSNRCPPGYGCSQFDFLEPATCVPIPEGGCTETEPCPEGLWCYQGSHHSEIGECEPVETSTGSTGSSTGASTGSTG